MENLGFVPTTLDAPERWSIWASLGISSLLGPLPLLTERLETEAGGAPASTRPVPAARASGAAPAIAQAGLKEPGRQEIAAPLSASTVTASLADSFPRPWQEAFAKTVFGRPLLWTYPELGQDLFGRPGAERRQVLRQLLAQLNLGSVHNFWPFSEPGQGDGSLPRLDLFEQGLARLSPKCVVYLGDSAAESVTGIAPESSFAVSFSTKLQVMCLFIPEINLLHSQAKLLNQAVSFLQTKLPAYLGV